MPAFLCVIMGWEFLGGSTDGRVSESEGSDGDEGSEVRDGKGEEINVGFCRSDIRWVRYMRWVMSFNLGQRR